MEQYFSNLVVWKKILIQIHSRDSDDDHEEYNRNDTAKKDETTGIVDKKVEFYKDIFI